MELEKLKKDALYVNMANELVRAAHGLTLMEKRLLMLAVSKLDSKKPATPDSMFIKLHVSEFSKEYGLESKNVYAAVKSASEQLMNRYIRFFIVKNGRKQEIRMQWVGQATYEESTGTVELGFWHKLAPMLFELEKQFTSYKLSRAGGLRSVYSWRLFELLMQFKKTGYLKIKLADFWDTMEVPKSMKSKFTNLKQRVIEPAIKEIQEKDRLKIKWNVIKTGRKITDLEFYFPVEQLETAKLTIDEQIAKYVRDNPETTRGMSRPEIITRLKEVKNQAKAA